MTEDKDSTRVSDEAVLIEVPDDRLSTLYDDLTDLEDPDQEEGDTDNRN